MIALNAFRVTGRRYPLANSPDQPLDQLEIGAKTVQKQKDPHSLISFDSKTEVQSYSAINNQSILLYAMN